MKPTDGNLIESSLAPIAQNEDHSQSIISPTQTGTERADNTGDSSIKSNSFRPSMSVTTRFSKACLICILGSKCFFNNSRIA